MKDKLLKPLLERQAYLNSLLKGVQESQEIVLTVLEIIERTEWEINTFSHMPDEGQEFIPPGLVGQFEVGNEHIRGSLPLPPTYNIDAVSSTDSVTTSGSTGTYSIVSRASELDSEQVQVWSNKYIRYYRDIQEKQSRFDKVKERLKALNADRVVELETARQAYSAAITNVGEKIAAGIAMRNVLEHLKGDLFEKARTNPRENMTWERMAERQTLGQLGGIEHRELINQEKEWNSLQRRLSDVAKGQKHGLVANLEDIWVKLMDHMFTVLGIIKLQG